MRKTSVMMVGVAAAVSAALIVLFAGAAWATPSTMFYTPATPYLQPFGVPHLTYDSYFNRTAAFPEDVGLTMGIIPGDKFQAEIGFDLFLPGEHPWQFNFKAGFPEGAMGKGWPGLTGGMFGIGTERNVNNFDILHLELGKTFPRAGMIVIGGYYGAVPDLMRSGDGDRQNLGWMVAYYRPLEPWSDRIGITADFMSGKNIFGGGGVGMYLWPSKNVDVILGWVWFNDMDLNPFPNGMFTIQLDVDFDFKAHFDKAPEAPALGPRSPGQGLARYGGNLDLARMGIGRSGPGNW